MNTVILDTTGLTCPEPIMLLHKTIRPLASGDVIEMSATDPASVRDVGNFCRHLGHNLLENRQENDIFYFSIQKK